MSFAPLRPLKGLPSLRCDDEDEGVVYERPFWQELVLRMAAGAAPVLAHVLVLKFMPGLAESPEPELEEVEDEGEE
jgi:hypothetical protein